MSTYGVTKRDLEARIMEIEEALSQIRQWARDGADTWSARRERRCCADPDGLADDVAGWYAKIAARYTLFAEKLDSILGDTYLDPRVAKEK